MSRNTVSPLVLCAAVLAVSCSGSSSPPVPAASPSTEPTPGGLRPLTSRDGGAPALPPGGSVPGDTGASLPPGHPPIEVPSPSTQEGVAGGSLSGTITISPELADRVGPTDILYIMAKKEGATLAVRRVEQPRFPFTFEISGGHAMVTGAPFEGQVDVVARISKTGDAIPSPGDLEGTTRGVAIPATGVRFTIDSVRE